MNFVRGGLMPRIRLLLLPSFRLPFWTNQVFSEKNKYTPVSTAPVRKIRCYATKL